MNEILIVSLYIFFNVGRGIEIWETINLGAVTHFEGIEEYYRNLRQQSKFNIDITNEARKAISDFVFQEQKALRQNHMKKKEERRSRGKSANM